MQPLPPLRNWLALVASQPTLAPAPRETRSSAPASADLLERYSLYLTGQRSLSDNTRRIYVDDLHTFLDYCRRNNHDLRDMDRQLLRGYVAFLATTGRSDGPRPTGYARVSIVRKLTALRTFYNFLVQEGWFKSTPVPSARSFPVKVEKPLPSFLGKQEATRLLAAPDDDTPAGLRDRAILEVLYACGVRLAELQGMNVGDINADRREILVRGKGDKERWTLYGAPAQDALDRYLEDGRPQFAATSGHIDPLFVNRYGGRLSRRSIEKIVRDYAARAGLKEGIHTPHPAPQFRQPHARGRRRSPRDPGTPRTQQRFHHPALYPHHQAGSPARLHGLPSPSLGAGNRS